VSYLCVDNCLFFLNKSFAGSDWHRNGNEREPPDPTRVSIRSPRCIISPAKSSNDRGSMDLANSQARSIPSQATTAESMQRVRSQRTQHKLSNRILLLLALLLAVLRPGSTLYQARRPTLPRLPAPETSHYSGMSYGTTAASPTPAAFDGLDRDGGIQRSTIC